MDSLTEKNWQLEQLMPLIREQLTAGKTVRFSPRGVSMLPMLRQGIDSVVLSPLPEKLKKYDLPLYQRESGQYVLHRITKVGQTYTCIGDNQFVYEPGLHQEQMIALVTEFYRGSKHYRVTDVSYRTYCRLWHYTRWPRRIWRGGIRRLKKLFK